MRIVRCASTSCRVLIMLLVAGCATTGAPRGWLPTPSEAESQAHGGWIIVRYDGTAEARGELISVAGDSVFVLPETGILTQIPKAAISRAKLTGYDAQAAKFSALTALGLPILGGALWTLGNAMADGDLEDERGFPIVVASVGFGLVATWPLSFLTGCIAGPVQSRKPQVKYPPTSWLAFRKYARFPQGLPEELRGSLPDSSGTLR